MVAKRLEQMASHWKVDDLINAATFIENLVFLQIYKKIAWSNNQCVLAVTEVYEIEWFG